MKTQTKQVKLTSSQVNTINLALFNLRSSMLLLDHRFNDLTLREFKSLQKLCEDLDSVIYICDYDDEAIKKLKKLIKKWYGSNEWIYLGHKIYQPLFSLAERNGWFD